jgi:hypothetical protein
MRNSMIISESERSRILSMHESFVPKRYREKTDSSSIPNLINQFIDELNFQKQVHLHSLSMIESNKRADYITNYQNKYVVGLFSHNQVISETYLGNFKNVITESEISYSDQLDKFNNFLVKSLLFDNGIITEQWWNPQEYVDKVVSTVSDAASSAYNSAAQTVGAAWDKTKQVAGQAWDATKQAGQYVVNQLASAVDYIKKNGLGFIFENLRKALMSGVGTAIQIALSFTGPGAIVNEVAWGIMTLYDAYQYFVNSAPGSLANLIIDLICLLTAGTLGKALGKLVGTVGTSITGVLQKFMATGVGQAIKPVLGVISGGASKLASWLGTSAKFMGDKMGITWVAGLLGKVVTFFKDMAAKLSGMIAAPIAKGLVRAGVTLGPKFEAVVFSQLAQKSEQELAKSIGNQITKAEVKLAEKYANEYLKEKPTAEALSFLDQKMGTKMGDAYALYLNTTKLASHTNKLASGSYDVVDFTVDSFRGDRTPYDKANRLTNKVVSSTEKLVGQ